ncbi:hypothetical protein KKC44_00985 [Patescibacteria group bacterium]|nr:hypothetical protein [Patescibacteria group bacterium]MBU2259158.1 hypothetical protein [Patescibacteria group bacterium]
MEKPNVLNSMPSAGVEASSLRHVSRVQRWFHNRLAGAAVTLSALIAAGDSSARAQELVGAGKPGRPVARAKDNVAHEKPLKVDEDKLLQEALNGKGWHTVEHDLSKEGQGIYSPCIVPPDQYFCRSMTIGQGAMVSEGAKDAEMEFYYIMPANFGDRGHLATKTVVYDGNNRVLPAHSKILYSLPDQRTGHRNAMMFVHVPNCPSGVPIYSQALHWLMVPSSSAPTELVMQRLALQNPQVFMGLKKAVDAAARYNPPVAPCGYKAQYCENLAMPYAKYVSGFVNNVGGLEVAAGEGRHAWVMVMVNGKYAFVDPLRRGIVPWGILDGYMPCSFSSETTIPEKNRTYVNNMGGSSSRFKSRSDNVGMASLSLRFLQNRQDIVFSDADLLRPPPEVLNYFDLRQRKRMELYGIPPPPRVAQVPNVPVREQLPEQRDVRQIPEEPPQAQNPPIQTKQDKERERRAKNRDRQREKYLEYKKRQKSQEKEQTEQQ